MLGSRASEAGHARERGQRGWPDDAVTRPEQEDRQVDRRDAQAVGDNASEKAYRQQHHQQPAQQVPDDDQPTHLVPVDQRATEQTEEQDGDLLAAGGPTDQNWV